MRKLLSATLLLTPLLVVVVGSVSFTFDKLNVKLFEEVYNGGRSILYPYMELKYNTSANDIQNFQCKATYCPNDGACVDYVTYTGRYSLNADTSRHPVLMYESNLNNQTCTEPVEFYVPESTQTTAFMDTQCFKRPDSSWFYPKGEHSLPAGFFKTTGYDANTRKAIRVPLGCKLRLTTSSGRSLDLKTPPNSCGAQFSSGVYTSKILTILMDQQGGMLQRTIITDESRLSGPTPDMINARYWADIVKISVTDVNEHYVTIAPRPMGSWVQSHGEYLWGRTYAVTCRLQDGKTGQWSAEITQNVSIPGGIPGQFGPTWPKFEAVGTNSAVVQYGMPHGSNPGSLVAYYYLAVYRFGHVTKYRYGGCERMALVLTARTASRRNGHCVDINGNTITIPLNCTAGTVEVPVLFCR